MPVIIVYGGQFGDEGKGKVSEYFANKYNAIAVVRVGGSQADHTSLSGKVYNVLPTCAGQRISILPSGSYIVPDRLYKEMEGLDSYMLKIDEAACIVTMKNQEEAMNSGRMDKIASHGLGTRDAVLDRLHGKLYPETFPAYYPKLKPYICNTRQWLKEQLNKGEYIIIEGTQGYGLSNHLLDMRPYTTSRTITPDAFCCEAGIDHSFVEQRIMCLRTFPIRVGGNSGELINEITWDIVTNESNSTEPIMERPVNTGKIHRVARFDNIIVKRAIEETNPTTIVMNMLDYIDVDCQKGELTPRAKEFINKVENDISRKIDYVGINKKTIIHNLR